MKNLSKKLLSILGLTIFGLFLVSNTTVSAETLENENLIKLDYTIDEIRKMSLGEYYQNIFPETFNEFTDEQKEELFNTPYERNQNSKGVVDFGPGYGSSFLTKTSNNRFNYSVTTNLKFTDGSVAKKIKHSSVLVDSNGTAWMIRSDSKSDSNYFNMSGYKDVTAGRYYLETVHTVTAPSGYWPSTASTVSSSGWVYSY